MVVRHNGSVLVFVHASSNYIRRRTLWNDLLGIVGSKICIMGEFNIVLGAHENLPVKLHMLPLLKNSKSSFPTMISSTLIVPGINLLRHLEEIMGISQQNLIVLLQARIFSTSGMRWNCLSFLCSARIITL